MYFSGKNVRKFSGTPRVLILELVARHRYHSSRCPYGNWSQTGCYYWEIKSNTSLYWLNVVQINQKLIGKHSTITSDRLLCRNATTHRLPNVDFPYLACLMVPSLKSIAWLEMVLRDSKLRRHSDTKCPKPCRALLKSIIFSLRNRRRG